MGNYCSSCCCYLKKEQQALPVSNETSNSILTLESDYGDLLNEQCNINTSTWTTYDNL